MSTPITLLYGSLQMTIFCILSGRVMLWRFMTRTGYGDREDQMARAMVRAHANFAEYVPVILVCQLAMELCSLPAWEVHAVGATLFVGRLFHMWGMWGSTDVHIGRRIGAGLTFCAMGLVCILSGYELWT